MAETMGERRSADRVAGGEAQPLDHLSLRGRGQDLALTVGEMTLTFADLEHRVGETAARLLELGLNPGDRVCSWMAKTELACVLPLATARAGMIHVPINPVLRRAQTAHILADSGARLLIANRARLDTLPLADRKEADAIALEDWSTGEDCLPPSDQDPAGLAALIYTSGSTGKPKGVMLSHANLWFGALSVAEYLGVGADDRTLAVLPLAFDYGQNQLLSSWAAGAHVIGFDYLLPRDVVRAVGRHDVTILAGVPPLWLQLTETQWPDEVGASLRTLTNSGGHLPEPVVRRLRQQFPEARLHLMYGLTEAFRSTSLDPDLVDSKPDSIGSAVPFAEVLVVNSKGEEAAAGEEGELVHAGPLVAQGYWRDPERTAERFREAPEFSRYGGLAVWSGDRVVRGPEGLIRFRGRDDAMIKASGHRISPTEIEEAALASGAVADAAAFGERDARMGQAIALIAVPKGGEAEERLKQWLAAELPHHMQPKRIIWRESMPLGPNGKLDRARLLESLS